MNKPLIQTGGRYPVLRAVGIIYLILAGIALIGGLSGSFWLLFSSYTIGYHTTAFLGGLVATFFTVVSLLAVAEVVKLFIDIADSARMAAMGLAARDAGAVPAPGGRLAALDEESAEAALLRGH